MRPALRRLFLLTAFSCGCSRAPTPAEREREVLPVVLRYFYEHDLSGLGDASIQSIYVGRPSAEWAQSSRGRPLIQSYYDDPDPESLAAFASSGISILPASRAGYTDSYPWYHDPKTLRRVVVFAIRSTHFSDKHHARVLTSACVAPLGGGETAYDLAQERGAWKVTREEIGAVY